MKGPDKARPTKSTSSELIMFTLMRSKASISYINNTLNPISIIHLLLTQPQYSSLSLYNFTLPLTLPFYDSPSGELVNHSKLACQACITMEVK